MFFQNAALKVGGLPEVFLDVTQSFSSGEEREARAVFSWEISNLESAVFFAFSTSATFQVQQQKAKRKIYAPIC